MKGKSKHRFNKFVSIGLITTLAASFCVSIMQSSVIGDNILSSFAAEVSREEIAFEFDQKENTLTLSGDVEMPDYTEQVSAPWGQYSDSTEKIVVGDGIKSLGDNAFVSFSDLSEVTIPQSVTQISDSAFVDCKEGFIIKGAVDSAADTFAQRNQYNFEALSVTASELAKNGASSEQTTTTTTAASADSSIPTGLSVTSESYNKLKISWNKVNGAAGYYLYCANSENGKYSIVKYVTGGDVTEYIHASRSYEKTYYYKITSYEVVNGKKVFSPDSEIVSGMTHVDPPAAVENVSVTCTDYNKLTIAWEQVDGAAGYYIYCATEPDGKYSLAKNITRGNVTEFVHSGRTYERMYYYKVCSYNKAGSKAILADASEIISGITHVDPPAAVQNVKVTCPAYNQLSVSWDKVEEASGYYVYWSSSPDGKYSLAKNITRNTTTTMLHSSRKLGVTYYYKVVSYNKAGYKAICAEDSEIISGATYLHVPSTPVITANANGTMKVSFTKVSGAYKYDLYRSTDGGEFTKIAAITGKYTDSNTIPGKVYAYKLASVRGSIVTDCSEAAAQTCTLQAPAISKAYSTGGDSIALRWNKVSDASGYAVYRSTEENGDYQQIGSVNYRTYAFTASGLDTGTRYYFKISAYKTVNGETGYSDYSGIMSAVPVIPQARLSSAQSIGYSSVYIEGCSVAGAEGYNFYRSDSANGEYTLIGTSEYYFYSDTDVSAGRTYYYKVCGYKFVGNRQIEGALSDYKKVTVNTTISGSRRNWSFKNKALQKPISSIKENTKYGAMDAHFVGDTERNVIYLNFSYGYATDTVNTVLDTLKEKDVKAGFFVTLNSVTYKQQNMNRIIDEGHVVGNHTAHNTSLCNISDSKMKTEIDLVEDYLLENYNYEAKFFSYPYGNLSIKGLNYVYSRGYTSIFWSYTYNDYGSAKVSTAQAYRNLTSNLHPGAIYLLHVECKANAEVLGDFIDYARSVGYEIEPIANLRNQ